MPPSRTGPTWPKNVPPNMTHLRGRAFVGKRLRAKVSHGHSKTATLIAALSSGGINCSTAVDGAVNADVYEAFVGQVLAPQLRPGDVVILDNLSNHKRADSRRLVEYAGATLLVLPRYSPDLNPIEVIFSNIKQLLRSMACRTCEAFWKAMQSVIDRVTASDAFDCFTHGGCTLQLD